MLNKSRRHPDDLKLITLEATEWRTIDTNYYGVRFVHVPREVVLAIEYAHVVAPSSRTDGAATYAVTIPVWLAKNKELLPDNELKMLPDLPPLEEFPPMPGEPQ